MVTNSDQADSVLFGEKGAAAALAKGATVVLCSTVPPDFVRGLEKRLASKSIAHSTPLFLLTVASGQSYPRLLLTKKRSTETSSERGYPRNKGAEHH